MIPLFESFVKDLGRKMGMVEQLGAALCRFLRFG